MSAVAAADEARASVSSACSYCDAPAVCSAPRSGVWACYRAEHRESAQQLERELIELIRAWAQREQARSLEAEDR